MKKEYFVLCIGCILGIVLRLWFISINPQPFQFDQYEYYYFALQILERGVFAESARLYGYPLLLAIVFKFFTIYNLQPVFVFQAILDVMTAILIYSWAKLLFRQKSIPWIAFILYLFNPYTSAYVGVILSEVTGVFFITLVMCLFTLFWLKKNLIVFLIFCLTTGFLPQIRPAFLYFAVGLLVLVLYKYWKEAKHTKFRRVMIAEGVILFILPFFYTLWGNVLYFKEWKLTNVDHIAQRELYISVKVPDRAPYHKPSGYDAYPKEVMQLYGEYSVIPTSQKERAAMGNKYFSQSIKIIKENPWLFVRQRLGKMFFVWEKHFLFYYLESPNMLRDILVYWGNIVLLMLGLTGLVKWWIDERKRNKKELMLANIYMFLILYISLIHSISLAEERYSLPGYPLLFLFAGYTLVFLWPIDF